MHTATKNNHRDSAGVPFPPAPHFDSASIEQAKPVEPLRRRRFAKSASRGLRLGMAIIVGLMFVILEITTMARLHRQINASSATHEISEPVATNETVSADESAAEVPSVAPVNTSTLAVNEVRRHRVRRHVLAPRVVAFDQAPLTGRPKARLVAVIH